MRLRYLGVEYFHEASRSSREEYLRHALPLPTVASLDEEFDVSSKSDGVAYICHRSLFRSSSPKISVELPRDFLRFEETNIHDRFLSEIFPAKLPSPPSIPLGNEVIDGLELVYWLSSDMEQIKVQVGKEDDNRISSISQIDSSEIHEVTPESRISDKVPHPSGSGRSTFGQHVKEQKPGSFVSEFLTIEPPQLELKDCLPQPDCWRTIILGLGGTQLSAVEPNEGLSLPKVNVPKNWFDILPIPCSLERWKNESTKVEARFKDMHELRRIDEACRSWRYPHEINDLVAKIIPIETRIIPENLNWKYRGNKEMTYPLKPTRLLQWFESHEGKMEKEAHNFPVGGFNIKVTLEENLTSKLVYHEEYTQPAMLPPGLLCDHCSPQPSSRSVVDSVTDPHYGTKLTFEIPRTRDWSLSSSAKTTPGIIIAHESEILVPNLPKFHPTQSFESAVVIPELSLDDQQFQFLPVPMTSCSEEQMIDAELGRLVSLNCEPCTLPATDSLYLDWHFFHGLKCTNASCFSLQEQLTKDGGQWLTRPVVTSQKDSKLAVELRLLENNDLHQDSSAISHVTGTPGEKIEALLCSQTRGKLSYQSVAEIQKPSEKEHKSLGHSQQKSQEAQPANDPVRRRDVRSTSVQSDSEFMVNDFDFFVRARKGIPVTGSDLQIINVPRKNSSNVVNKQTLSMTPGHDDQDHPTGANAFCEHEVCEHEVEISKEIRKCMFSLSSDYFALLAVEEISELKTPGDLKTLKQFGFDADGNSYLTSLISNMADEPVSGQRQMALRGLIALHVLRHTALNLCSYGIQVGHLYLENCFEQMQFLEGHIMSSRTELEEAYDHVERGMVEDHPKLSHLDKLLGPVALEIHRSKYLSTKILLLADRRAFFTVVRKLVSLGLTPYQIDRKENYLQNGVLQEDSLDKLKDEISEALTFSDCLLVSYAYVNPSFPVQRFTMIIQYADSPQTSATISSWTKGRYVIHFFKTLVRAEEFRMKCSSSASQRQTDCQDPQEHNLCGSTSLFKPNTALTHSADQSLSESSTLNQTVPPSEHEQTTHSSSGGATEQIIENCSSDRREMIIVANIAHPNDHILTGRRSSYQKILHLEKENLQVVERDLRLPVDLLLSPASCIVVYTLDKLNLEPHNLKGKQETVQNEVLTHLKAISFSFRDCIMIFEGPTEFTTAALEISAQIYTLAIALNMQFQCFASRHQDVTDTILIHSIQAVRRSKHMPSYPIMTEGPTLAEVFLTGFPSINPLTAHAILSSGCPLPLFMSYSPEQQYAAVEPYEVPKHCLELFKAQCTFKAIGTTGVSDCKRVEAQTNQPDMGISYEQHQVESPVVCVDVPNQASIPEVWASFPEFPPASAISEDSPTHNVRDMNPINSFPDFPPISDISPFQLEKRHFPRVTSVSVNGSNRLGGGHEILQDSEEPIRRSQLGVKRGASSFSVISPTFYGVRQDMGLNNALGSWNDHKRVRGVISEFMTETFDLQDIDAYFKSKLPRGPDGIDDFPSVFPDWIENSPPVCEETNLNSRFKQSRRPQATLPTGPNGIDEFPSVCPDWIENSPPMLEETNLNPRLRQSRRPQANLKISSLDRFRYQTRTPAPTASNSYTQTTIKFPKIKLPRAAPRRSRTQSPSVTYLPPTIAGKPTTAKKTFSEVAADRRPRAILGVARRGSDTQQRLVWKTDPSSSSLKRQKRS